MPNSDKLVCSPEELLKIVAHDLKQPINGIVGLLTILADNSNSVTRLDAQEMFDALLRGARSCEILLDNVLNWQLTESGEYQAMIRPVRIVEHLESCMNACRPSATLKNIACRVKSCPPKTVELDFRAMRVIVINLLSNAVKFTPRGGEVSIEAVVSDSELKLIVSDTGVGMTTEQQFALRDGLRLQSVPGTDGESGTGFGLQLSGRLVRAMKGSLQWDSQIEMGTKVTLTVPI